MEIFSVFQIKTSLIFIYWDSELKTDLEWGVQSGNHLIDQLYIRCACVGVRVNLTP